MQQKGKRTLWVVRDGSRESDTRPEARPGGSRRAGACGAVFWAGSQDPGSGVGVGAGEGEEGLGDTPGGPGTSSSRWEEGEQLSPQTPQPASPHCTPTRPGRAASGVQPGVKEGGAEGPSAGSGPGAFPSQSLRGLPRGHP